jgi:mono/diheme cytochrome c family protein
VRATAKCTAAGRVTSIVTNVHSMNRLHSLLAVVAACFVPAACWLLQDKPFDFSTLQPTPQVHAEVERLFNANCASCHGPKAAGSARPSGTSAAALQVRKFRAEAVRQRRAQANRTAAQWPAANRATAALVFALPPVR